jgi:hypothetical protein
MKRLFLTLMLLTTVAWASAPSGHELWVRAALSRVPVGARDKASPERLERHAQNLDVFAVEIAKRSANAPLPPQQWSALLATQGGIESNLDTEIVAGRCLPKDCDVTKVKGATVFRAVGGFQQHNVSYVSELWPTAAGNIPVQVEMADRTLRRSLSRCKPFAPFPAHVFRAYRGGSCSWPVLREAERVALYTRLMATPRVKTGNGDVS